MSNAAGVETHHLEFAAAIDQMNCGVLGRDLEGIVIFANERIASWLGYEPEELIGEPLSRLVPEELDSIAHEQMREVEGGDIRARITILKRKDSTTFPVLMVPNQHTSETGPFFVVVVELATIQTARPVGYGGENSLRSSLERIALEIQTLGIASSVSRFRGVPLQLPDLKTLSQREREVLVHLVSGKRVPNIAKHLHISPHTVRNHLKSIYKQLGVGSQSELIEHIRSLADPAGSEPSE